MDIIEKYLDFLEMIKSSSDFLKFEHDSKTKRQSM